MENDYHSTDFVNNCLFAIPYFTLGTVILLSAIFVAKIIFRTFASVFLKTKLLCCESDVECKITGIILVSLFLKFELHIIFIETNLYRMINMYVPYKRIQYSFRIDSIRAIS